MDYVYQVLEKYQDAERYNFYCFKIKELNIGPLEIELNYSVKFLSEL